MIECLITLTVFRSAIGLIHLPSTSWLLKNTPWTLTYVSLLSFLYTQKLRLQSRTPESESAPFQLTVTFSKKYIVLYNIRIVHAMHILLVMP